MSGVSSNFVNELRQRAADWDIHKGSSYFASSKMDLNRRGPAQAEGSLFTRSLDTAHDLKDYAQFQDWMDSRAAQADALCQDLADYAVVLKSQPDFCDTKVGMALRDNLASRTLMALYGIDEGRHVSTLEHQAYNRDEWPYDYTRSYISSELSKSGAAGFVDALRQELNDFSYTWEEVRSEELTGSAKPDGPALEIVFSDRKQPVDLHSYDSVQRYIAEVRGREAYFNRAASLDESEELSVMKLRSDSANLLRAGVIAKAMSTGDICPIGRKYNDVKFYAFDAGSIVKTCESEGKTLSHDFVGGLVRDEFMTKMPEYDDAKSTASFEKPVSNRYTGDLDAEYAGIDHQATNPNVEDEMPF